MEVNGEEWPHFALLLQGGSVVSFAKLSDCSLQEEATILMESRT